MTFPRERGGGDVFLVAGGGSDDDRGGGGDGEGRLDSITPSGSFLEERIGCFVSVLIEACFAFFSNSS